MAAARGDHVWKSLPIFRGSVRHCPGLHVASGSIDATAPGRGARGAPGPSGRRAGPWEPAPCLESLAACLAVSSQRTSGPAGGAPDGYGLGRGAAGPAVGISLLRLLRVASRDAAGRVSAHAPPPEPNRDRGDWRTWTGAVWMGTDTSTDFDHCDFTIPSKWTMTHRAVTGHR